MTVPSLKDSKREKEKIIQELAKMPTKVRSMIAEVQYDPQENLQNQIKLYTTDEIQIVGNLNTIANKMKYYPQMSQSLERDESGSLKNQATLICQLVLLLFLIVVEVLLNQQVIKMLTKETQKKIRRKTSYKVP